MGGYSLDIRPFLDSCHEEACIRHEMAIEAALLYQLATRDKATTKIFGEWDYLSHQVIASPFKPIDYIDKMDVFGYSFIPNHKPTRSKYLLAELKRDAALVEDVEQTMKYVDWVKDEYCHSNYSMISAFLVASDFNEEVIEAKRRSAKRQYVTLYVPKRMRCDASVKVSVSKTRSQTEGIAFVTALWIAAFPGVGLAFLLLLLLLLLLA